LVPVLFSNGVASECQGGWIQNGTSCYYFSNTLKDWVSASVGKSKSQWLSDVHI